MPIKMTFHVALFDKQPNEPDMGMQLNFFDDTTSTLELFVDEPDSHELLSMELNKTQLIELRSAIDRHLTLT